MNSAKPVLSIYEKALNVPEQPPLEQQPNSVSVLVGAGVWFSGNAATARGDYLQGLPIGTERGFTLRPFAACYRYCTRLLNNPQYSEFK